MRVLEILILLTLLVPATARGVDASSIETQLSQFFETIAKGDVDAAFSKLAEGSSLAKTDPLGVNQMPSSVEAMMKVTGPMLDYERVSSCHLGARSIKLVYLQNLKVRPLTWVFYYYNNNDGWTLTYLLWNGQYSGFADCPLGRD